MGYSGYSGYAEKMRAVINCYNQNDLEALRGIRQCLSKKLTDLIVVELNQSSLKIDPLMEQQWKKINHDLGLSKVAAMYVFLFCSFHFSHLRCLRGKAFVEEDLVPQLCAMHPNLKFVSALF